MSWSYISRYEVQNSYYIGSLFYNIFIWYEFNYQKLTYFEKSSSLKLMVQWGHDSVFGSGMQSLI